jgi:hypothetical protein
MFSIAPTGLRQQSPGLSRSGGYPGKGRGLITQPQRGCAGFAHFFDAIDATALRLRNFVFTFPRVAVKARQPWAVRRSPVGALGKSRLRGTRPISNPD